MINWFEKNKFVSILMVVLITIEIFYFSSLPGTAGVGGNPWVARAYHFIVFFLFGFFLLTAIKGNKRIKVNYLLIVLLISILHAFLDEFHQIFVPFRDASMRDVLTDSLGIWCSAIIYYFIDRKRIIF